MERLIIDPTNPNIVYGEGGGVFKSTDGGKSWRPINSGLTDPGRARGLVIDPTVSSILFVGTTRGVFKSTNGGETWSPTGAKDLIGGALTPGPGKP
jgi:photosystem II stability/assembly factor-like uncharacterized protein